MSETTSTTPGLARTLSLPVLVLYGLGNIVGAGIYVIIGEVAGRAGVLAPWSFIIASLLAAVTACSYGELSARYPVSAGEAVYFERAFHHRRASIVIGVVLMLTGVLSAAALSRGFAGYARLLLPIPAPVAITLLVLALGCIAAWGMQFSGRLAAAITLVEIAGLLLVVWVSRTNVAAALGNMFTGPTAGAAEATAGSGLTAGVLLGSFIAFYAFTGFEDIVNAAEEVRDPKRTMPRAIVLALVVATVLYIIVALAALGTVAPHLLAESEAPLGLVYERATGTPPVILGFIGGIAVINGALIQIIMASRVLYGMSREGWIPAFFQQVHPTRHTPLRATAVAVGVVLTLALLFPIAELAEATSLLVLITFVLMNAALWKIKREEPHPEGIATYPMWIPQFGVFATTGYLLFRVVL